jgi:hypothetical protein
MVTKTLNPPATKRAGKSAPIKVKGQGPCKITHSLDGRTMMEAGLSLAAFWDQITGMRDASSQWSPGRHKFVFEIDHRPTGTARAPTKRP